MASPAPPSELVAQLLNKELMQPGDTFEPLAGGRTNQVWKLRGAGRARVLKLYRNNPDNPLFPNDPTREALCLAAFAPHGLSPLLYASGRSGRSGWIVYDHAAGGMWRHDTPAVAQLLAQVHAHPPTLPLPPGCNGSDNIRAHGMQILGRCRSGRKHDILAHMPAEHLPPISRPRIIHGDPVAGNILVDGTRMMLIDWQCPVLGDPTEDLALFLSPAMMLIYRGHPASQAEVDDFLAAYPDAKIVRRYHGLRRWYGWRMAAYCLWRAEQGAAEYAAALEPELEQLVGDSPADAGD